MLDESSLASTKQVRDFLAQLEASDRVLFIGDTRQHQGVEAGKPFEQLVNAGMKTTQLDQIVRQQADPELLRAVEHLSRGEIAEGVALLEQQGRVTEIVDSQQRIAAIAWSYAASPDNTIVVSPDNASRREINQAVRASLQASGLVQPEDHVMRILTPRSDMTGADRAWAARYQVDDVLRYQKGSKDFGIEPGSYATVLTVDPQKNLLTVQKSDGTKVTYDPSRLRGISAYREIERAFAVSDRLESGKSIDFDPASSRHFDHGYAVTSHSSQGLTARRVLVNIDTASHRDLINSRLAYVSVSRASFDAQIYTNDASCLTKSLSNDISKSSAIEFIQVDTHSQSPPM
jgi:ATP-dependent exoDNAse (exonuclease V) alpha subunit